MRDAIYTLSCSDAQVEAWARLKKEGKFPNNDWSRMTAGLRNKILRKVESLRYAK